MSTENEAPVLEDLLCFDLYATSRQVIAAYRPLLEEAQLTYPQYLVLVSLWERDGITMKQLSIQVHLDYGTISPLVKRLEARGLVNRARNPFDERSTIVSLTEEGETMRPLAQRMYERLSERLNMSWEEASKLRLLLDRLRHGVELDTD